MAHFIMILSDFDYKLPKDLIACYPLNKRSASRLLCLDKKNGAIAHKKFVDLPSLLCPGDLLIVNNSRVIPARLFARKLTGGHAEILIERILSKYVALAHVRASKSPKIGSILYLNNNSVELKVRARVDNLYELECFDDRSFIDIIELFGEIPLPPYFQRKPDDNDKERYQTVYAEANGSVAAPTAGLHFDQEIIEKLQKNDINFAVVTLHVGAGTFAPVRVDDIKQHRMHSEYAEISAEVVDKIKETKKQGGRIIAVGTTAARTLETASISGELKPFSGETDIFIYPGVSFNCIDGLITNFHLPNSTLLMLVAAFGGYENVMAAYKSAVELCYRFYSYGDAMFIV